MIHTRDLNKRGNVFQFQSIDEIMDIALTEMPKQKIPVMNGRASWVGRSFDSWQDLRDKFYQPWSEGVEKVEKMMEELRWENIAPPVSLRRRPKWSDCSGGVSVDRALAGEMTFMRRMQREHMTGPQNVVIVLNVGNRASVDADAIFWRGAAAIAAIDLLEEAGYGCEVWMYNFAIGTYEGHDHQCPHSFVCCKLKETGTPLDIPSLVNATSSWFFRCVMINMRALRSCRENGGWGGSQPFDGGYKEYMDISKGVREVAMPAPTYKSAAIKAAKTVLESVTKQDEESAK